jgi:signal transduction histidine kinase
LGRRRVRSGAGHRGHGPAGGAAGGGRGPGAGRESERADALRTLHDTVLQTFGLIAQRAGDRRQAIGERLDQITRLAGRQADELRAALSGADLARPAGPLRTELERLAHRQAEQGLEVVLLTDGLDATLPANPAVVGAVQEALQNVRKHAGVATASVEVISSPSGVEVIVRDRGAGFDPAAVSEGFGMPRSLRQRLSDEGGSAEISSTPGQGTTVRLRLAGGEAEPAGTLADRVGAVEWVLVVPLLLRTVFVPVVAAGGVSMLGLRNGLPIHLAFGGLLVWNVLLLTWATKPAHQARLVTRTCLAVDVLAAAAFGLWAARVLRPGDLLVPGPDVPWVYLSQTVAVWAVVAGLRTGIGLIAGGAALGLLMVRANGISLGEAGLTSLLGRLVVLCAGVALVWTIVTLAQRGVRSGLVHGQEAGRAAERAGVLLDLHENALRTLEGISQLAGRGGASVEEVVHHARAMTLVQADRLRDVLVADDAARCRASLAARLADLARVYGGQGLRVELVTPELEADPPEPVIDALIQSARWALDNVCVHASTPQVVVWASGTAREAEVAVRDQGVGFDTSQSPTGGWARAHMAAVGGAAEVWSSPGRGTRVRLSWTAR